MVLTPFPDFSYTKQMELILTVIALGSQFMFVFFSVNILLKLYNENPPLNKRIKLSLVASSFYAAIIYCTYALYSFQNIPDSILLLITIPNPLLAALCYFGSVKFLKLSSYKSINVIRQVYIYMLVIESLNILIRRTFFVQSTPYNYLLDAISMLLCDLIYIAIHLIVNKYIDFHSSIIWINDSISVKNKRLELVHSSIAILFFYTVISYMLVYEQNLFGRVIALTSTILFLTADIMLSYNRAISSQIEIKNTHIASLSSSVLSFNQLRLEFQNTLENYDKYLKQGQIDKLRDYHELLMGKTISTNEKIELLKKTVQNPVVISLLLNKIDYAEKVGVLFHIPVLCDLQELYIEDIDLSRILSNLLDNAIEAAAIAPNKRVSFSIKQMDDACKIIIISNSTKDDVDIDKISIKGVSTKEGHSGLGLPNVRNIIRSYGNSSLHFTYFQNEFSVYILSWESI